MKILITGATGFIGKHVVDFIESLSCDIIVTSSNEEGLRNIYKNRNVKVIKYNIYKTIQHDLNLYDYFDRPDKLIHLAWKGLPNYYESFHLTENLIKDFDFISNLVMNGLKDVTITGTCFEYGMLEGELDENAPSNPMNYYALAKDTLRKMLEILQSQYNFDLKWVRLFYMYGTGQHINSIIPQLEKAISTLEKVFNMSGGEQLRDYLPVTVVAKNIVAISLQSQFTGIINNCSGIPIKVINLVEDYLKSHNQTITLNLGYYPYSRNEPMAFWGNNTILKQILNLPINF